MLMISSVPRRRRARRIAPLVSAVALALPALGHAQTDPGPPPATAAVVPTIEQARAFIERQLPPAASRSCFMTKSDTGKDWSLDFEHRLSVGMKGADITLTQSDIRKTFYDSGNNTEEGITVAEFDIRDMTIQVDPGKTNSILGCGGAVTLKFTCDPARGNCISIARSSTSVASDGDIDKRSFVAKWPSNEFSLSDAATANRLLKAWQFYKKSIGEAEGASPF